MIIDKSKQKLFVKPINVNHLEIFWSLVSSIHQITVDHLVFNSNGFTSQIANPAGGTQGHSVNFNSRHFDTNLI